MIYKVHNFAEGQMMELHINTLISLSWLNTVALGILIIYYMYSITFSLSHRQILVKRLYLSFEGFKRIPYDIFHNVKI